MAINFTQTDTDTHCNTGVDGRAECVESGTAGTSEQTVTIPGQTTQTDLSFEIDITNETGPNGSWTIRLNVTTSDMTIDWISTDIVVRNGSCTQQGSSHTENHTDVDLGSTGVKSVTFTASGLPSLSSGDRITVQFLFTNSAHGDASFGFTPDQDIDTPLTSVGPTDVTLSATATGIATLGPNSIFKTLATTAIGVPRLARLVFNGLSATAIGVAALGRVKLLLQAVAATAIGIASLVKTPFLNIRGTATGTVALGRLVFKTLASTAIGLAGLSTGATKITVAAVATGVAVLARMPILTLRATAAGVGTLNKNVATTLAAVVSGIATLDPVKLTLLILAATATGVSILSRTVFKGLGGTAVGVSVIGRTVFKTLNAAATGVGTVIAASVKFVTITAIAAGVAVLTRLVTTLPAPFTGAGGMGFLSRKQTAWQLRKPAWRRRL